MVLVDSTAPATATATTAKPGVASPGDGASRHHGRVSALALVSARLGLVDGTTHISLIVDEDDAAATTQAILDVVSSVRSAGPLVR
jgi:hypothetical protein